MPRGYEDLGEYELNCPNCHIHILSIIKAAESSQIQKFQVICPKCKDESFITTVTGEVYVGSTNEEFVIVDITTSVVESPSWYPGSLNEEKTYLKHKIEVSYENSK